MVTRALAIAFEKLSQYDVVINNHSTETQLILPALPANIVRLSVIRSVDDLVILGAHLNSEWLDAMVGISAEVARRLNESRIVCTVHTIPNACMVDGYRPASLGLPLRLLYLGRLTNIDKNILILPEIARCLIARGIDFSLTIAGDGPDRFKLERRASELGVDSHIRFLGAVSRDKVNDLFAASHFAIFPSNYEGFGLTLTEAMATGCVPIASDIPAYRWILGEDATFLMSPVKDVEAYADRLLAIVAAPELYARLQARLLRRQRKHFAPEVTVERYLKLIAKLQETRDPNRFEPVPFASLTVPEEYRRDLSLYWHVLRTCRSAVLHPMRACRYVVRMTDLNSCR